MKKLTNRFFAKNRSNLLSKLRAGSTVVLFSAEEFPLNGDQNYKFRQNSDTYYFSGLTQEDSIIVLSKDLDNTIREFAFIIKADLHLEIWTGHKYTKEEARKVSGIENIEYLDNYDKFINKILKKSLRLYISFCSNYRGGIKYINQKNEYLISLIHKKFKHINIENIDNISKSLRLIKSSEEIAIMQEAINITKGGFDRVLKQTRPGVYENEIEAILTYSFVANRANGHAYAPIVATGENNCTLHYITNNKKCKKGELLLLDFGADYLYYAADVSRTIPISGRYSAFQKKVYNSVLSVLNQMKQKYVVGKTIRELNQECCVLIEEELLKLKIINKADISKQETNNPILRKYFMHGVCHFLGLDVHDVGGKDIRLEPGMVLTCEPGIYIREKGVGIRLENDILITASTPIDLCSNIPIEAEEIEDLMNKE